MKALNVLIALFAAFMLFRHGPRAVSLVRGQQGRAPMAVVSLVNVVLAVALLAVAVKGMVAGLISR